MKTCKINIVSQPMVVLVVPDDLNGIEVQLEDSFLAEYERAFTAMASIQEILVEKFRSSRN
jgi:hypothetical protein